MTKQEKIDLAWERVMGRLASLNIRAPDAKRSPMSSRFVLSDAKELVEDAAILKVLLHMDDKPVAVEAGLWKWVRDEKDCWFAEVESTSLTVAVWPETSDCWHYEVFDGEAVIAPDSPVRSGTTQTFDSACKSAEKALEEVAGIKCKSS